MLCIPQPEGAPGRPQYPQEGPAQWQADSRGAQAGVSRRHPAWLCQKRYLRDPLSVAVRQGGEEGGEERGGTHRGAGQ